MAERFRITIEKAMRGGQDEVMFLDIYNKNYNGKTFGAILTGVDFRGLHYLMEYETQNDNGQGEDGDAVSHNRQERQSHL